MKILVICQHYWPEPYYLSDVCEELVKRGHEVHVVTDVPNYPMGYIYADYRNRKNREETRNGVKISRTFTIPRRNNALLRLLNYYSYSFSSALYVNQLPDDYDVVFANQTSPIMMTRAATLYSKKWNKQCVLYCMDLWPASLAVGGIKPGSIIYRFYGKVSSRLYNRADRILITSQMFKSYLNTELHIPPQKISYLPQYAVVDFPQNCLQADKKTIDFVFAGNIGLAQGIDVFIKTAKLLEDYMYNETPILWHIVGDGSQLGNLKELTLSLGLRNVFFHGRKTGEEISQYYEMADAMLVSLIDDPFISLTLPGKVQTCMSTGKPILASANGEISRMIEKAQCGYCAPAGDAEAFAIIVKKFINMKDRGRLGDNAKKYYENNFTRDRFMDELERYLEEAAVRL